MKNIENQTMENVKFNSKSTKALSIAILAGAITVGINTTAMAENDTRLIINTIDQTVTGDYSNKINNNDWHTDDWSKAWYSEWSVNGGVIQNNSENLTIKDATFDNNTFTLHNPDILHDGSNPQYMEIKGGVLGNAQGATIKEISNVVFSNNVVNATYKPDATKDDGQQAIRGGVISNAGLIDSINNVTFKDNKTDGGYVEGGSIYNAGTINEIDKTTIDGSNAKNQGGAIHNIGSIGTISNTEITNSSSEGGASAIYNGGIIDKLDNVNIHDNKNTGKVSWGAVINYGTINSVENSHFNNNDGSGFYILKTDNSTATVGSIINSEIKGNSSYGINSFGGNIDTIENTLISENGRHGLYFNQDSSKQTFKIGSISDSTFSDNGGAGLYLNMGVSVGDITNTKFLNNGQKNNSDAAIYVNCFPNGWRTDTYSLGNLTDVLFEGNKNTYGIWISSDGSDYTVGNLKNVTFRNNGHDDSWNGASICLNPQTGNLKIGSLENVLFEGNKQTGIEIKASYKAEIIFGDWKNVTFKDNISIDNVASAIQVGSSGDKLFFGNWENVNFINNKSKTTNGHVIRFGTYAEVGDWNGGVMQGADLVDGDKLVYSGAGIDILNGGKFGNISNVDFKNLHASAQGGGY